MEFVIISIGYVERILIIPDKTLEIFAIRYRDWPTFSIFLLTVNHDLVLDLETTLLVCNNLSHKAIIPVSVKIPSIITQDRFDAIICKAVKKGYRQLNSY